MLWAMQVFTVGVFWGTETFSWPTLGNLMVITVGVIIAAYGEINFVLVCNCSLRHATTPLCGPVCINWAGMTANTIASAFLRILSAGCPL